MIKPMMLAFALLAIIAFLGYHEFTSQVMIVDGIEKLGCLNNRCYQLGDTTILVKK